MAWGDNGFGELGDGSTAQSDLPVSVKLPAGVRIGRISCGPGASNGLAIEE
jgi:Regulator of chromosome condensation (RCC1) repeat